MVSCSSTSLNSSKECPRNVVYHDSSMVPQVSVFSLNSVVIRCIVFFIAMHLFRNVFHVGNTWKKWKTWPYSSHPSGRSQFFKHLGLGRSTVRRKRRNVTPLRHRFLETFDVKLTNKGPRSFLNWFFFLQSCLFRQVFWNIITQALSRSCSIHTWEPMCFRD